MLLSGKEQQTFACKASREVAVVLCDSQTSAGNFNKVQLKTHAAVWSKAANFYLQQFITRFAVVN